MVRIVKNMPSVSIGIITANRLPYLKVALASALQPEVTEVVVVVDGSKDGTVEYLSSVTDPRLKVVTFSENRGRPAARNAIVENFSGDCLVWLDDDDAFVDGAISEHLAHLTHQSEADIVYVNHIACDEQLQIQEVTPSKSIEEGQMLMHMVFENPIPNGGTLIRRRVFEKIGAYDLRFHRAQDYHFYARAALAGFRIVHLDKGLYRFRYHSNNLANPLLIRDQSKYQCMILQEILAGATIESLFPMFAWEAEPKQSGARALMIVGRVFFDHGDDDSALECLQQADGFHSDAETKLMLGFILRAKERYEEACKAFASAAGLLAPSLAPMNVEIGAPRGSAKVAEEAQKGAS